MDLKHLVRQWMLDPEEIATLNFGASYLKPVAHLHLHDGRRWNSSDVTYPDLFWGKGRTRLGWIQTITLDIPGQMATVGHFAIDRDLVGLG